MDSINNSSITTISIDDLTLSDTIVISDSITTTDTMASSSVVSIDLSSYGAAGAPYTYSSGSAETITLGNIDFSNWSIEETIPFENGFPAWKDFQEMCKEYPGLYKTFEHLKVFYNLCRSEWEAKKRGDA